MAEKMFTELTKGQDVQHPTITAEQLTDAMLDSVSGMEGATPEALEQLQSPLLTAEWEYRLGEIERGQLAPEEFLDGISTMLKDLVGTYQVIKGTEYLFSPPRDVVGKCPRCGGEVAELQKGFFCQNDSCKFAIWKNNKWWAAKKKQPTKAVVSALLKDGRVRVTGLYSEKTGKTYDAAVVLEDDGQYANFKLEFDQRKGGSR